MLPLYNEVWVRCSLQTLVQRDAKGLYARAGRGDLPLLDSVYDAFDEPQHADCVIDTDRYSMDQQNVAQFLVSCLRAEGVEYVFGIPGEENIRFVRAVAASGDIRFILARHEQGAAFMADIYGRLTGKAGVCTATLGPGAINLLLGVADAQTNSSPLVAISAQVGLKRIYKESHQIVDLVGMNTQPGPCGQLRMGLSPSQSTG